MRPVIAVLCALLVVYGAPVQAGQTGSARQAQLGLPETAFAGDLSRAWPPPAHGIRLAQVGAGAVPEDVERRIAELKFERDGINVWGPRAAMIAGSVTTGVASAYLILVGGLCGDCSAAGRLYGTAGGFLFAGLVTLGTSLAVLVPRNRRVRAIDREILDLEYGRKASAASPTWSLSFEAGERKMLGLSMRF